VRVSAKADYAVRAMLELTDASSEEPAKGEAVSEAQAIPARFLENILSELRQQGLVQNRVGADGGYWLARPADQITIAEVIRAVDGPLASVRGEGPEEVRYEGTAAPLQRVWVALRTAILAILETVTLADVAADELPATVTTTLSRRDDVPDQR
jgi:Rrf2 family protein